MRANPEENQNHHHGHMVRKKVQKEITIEICSNGPIGAILKMLVKNFC